VEPRVFPSSVGPRLASLHSINLHVSYSSLRRVPEMPHSISAKFQPVSQRIVSDPAHRARRHRVDPVLFLPCSACVQSVEFDGLEAIRNLQTSLSSRLRLSGGSVGCDPSLVGWSLTLQLSFIPKSGVAGACRIGQTLKTSTLFATTNQTLPRGQGSCASCRSPAIARTRGRLRMMIGRQLPAGSTTDKLCGLVKTLPTL